MEYISAIEASEKWGVSLRQVQRLLANNRIPRAKKYGRSWMIPGDAEKPADPRREKKPPGQSLSNELAHVIEATSVPMPLHNPDAILEIVKEERLRLLYESELAYLRGDFQQTMHCFRKTKGDEAVRLRACLIGVAAVISLGDYGGYVEIEAYLKDCMKAGQACKRRCERNGPEYGSRLACGGGFQHAPAAGETTVYALSSREIFSVYRPI